MNNENKMNLLIAEDDAKTRSILEINLSDKYNILFCENGKEALQALREKNFDILITDWKMPVMDGRELLLAVRKEFPGMPVIVITAFGSIQNAVDMMTEGAFYYIEKPVKLDNLEVILDKASKTAANIRENKKLQEELESLDTSDMIISKNEVMRSLIRYAKEVSNTDFTVLVQGETGTGKDLFSRLIHYSSPRKDKPFVAINCGAIPKDLIESELFGSEKGAFTGSVGTITGKFEAAQGGSIFLDEIGELPMDMQVKLLRVLEEKKVTRLGSTVPINVDVRIIAATNQPLKELVDSAKFRSDLYYRLNVINIVIPPLRERKDDIALLSMHFINKRASQFNNKIKGIENEVIEYFKSLEWQGNVREFENVIMRAMLNCKSEYISLQDLPDDISLTYGDNRESLPEKYSDFLKVKQEFKEKNISELEKKFLLEALRKNKWNITHTARNLEMDRRLLQKMIKENGLIFPDED